MCLVIIVQHMWRAGNIPQELGWTVLIIIPKGSTYTQGISLMETPWKVVEALIDISISASIYFCGII